MINLIEPMAPVDPLAHIRIAEPHDEFDVFKLLALCHEEQPIHPLAWDKITAFVRLATRKERGIIGVIGERYELKAMVFLVLEEVWWSHDWELRELVNFVHPEHRRSTYGKDLIRFAHRCADRVGVDLTMGVLSGVRTAAKVRLYRRQFGPELGVFFVHRPPQVEAVLGPIPRQSFPDLATAAPANMVAAE